MSGSGKTFALGMGSRVREAVVGDVAQLSALLADAFATEPITQWLSGRAA